MKISIIVICLLSFLASSCGHQQSEDTQAHKNFSTLLGIGKKVPLAAQRQTHGLYVQSNNSLVQQVVDESMDSPGWLRFDTRSQPLLESQEDVRIHAIATIKAFCDDLGLPAEAINLEPLEASDAKGFQHLRFQRLHNGIKVANAHITLVYQKALEPQGMKLREILNRSYGKIFLGTEENNITLNEATIASLTGMQAFAITKPAQPIIHVSVTAEGYSFASAKEVSFQDRRSRIEYRIVVDTVNRQLLAASSDRKTAKSQILAKVYPRTYMDKEKILVPLANTNISHPSDSGESPPSWDFFSKTDDNGFYNRQNHTGSIQLTLSGSNIYYTDKAETAVIDMHHDGDNDSQAILDNSHFSESHLNAYTSVSRVVSFVRKHLRTKNSATQFLYTSSNILLLFTNLEFMGCNAGFSPVYQALFFGEKDDCDTSLILDVVAHEWGHYYDYSTGMLGGITDGALSEGFADILSTMITRDSNFSPGLFGDEDTPLRKMENTVRHPPQNDEEAQVHRAGQIIGGTFFDTVTGFKTVRGDAKAWPLVSSMFLEHMLTTDAYVDSYAALLRLDDDDGNPITPSPNHCKITRAFSDHGLASYPPDACIDNEEMLKVRLTEQGEGAISLTVASYGPDSIRLCKGPHFCTVDEAVAIYQDSRPMAPLGTFRLYASDVILEPSAEEYTLFAISSSVNESEILAKRHLQFRAN